MQTIRIHRRSRVESCWQMSQPCWDAGWLLFCGVGIALRFLATLVCGSIAIACSVAMFGQHVFLLATRQTSSLCDNVEIFCHSPDQRLCPDFDVALKDIDKVTTDSDGWTKLSHI